MTRRYSARGLTVVELLAIVVVVVVIMAVLMPVINPRRNHGARQMKDARQVRCIPQAMAIWANDNNGLFPLPSVIDAANTTVGEEGSAKDTTANILSVLVYTGGISVELTISPAESNTSSIVQDDDYMFDVPETALDPANALWDPAFAADFTNGRIGNTSYAHVLPGGGRGELWRDLWRDTSAATEPVIGNRGPQVASVNASGVPTFALASSNTFLIHGSRKSWEGNVAYNDCHVAFETRTNPDGVRYRNTAGKKRSDNLFFDEPDDATGHNAWMSIWTTAGDAKADFTPIWD